MSSIATETEFVEEEKPISQLNVIKAPNLNFTFMKTGNALIYIAMSRVGDSVTF